MGLLDRTGDRKESCVEQEADGSRAFRVGRGHLDPAARPSGPPSRVWTEHQTERQAEHRGDAQDRSRRQIFLKDQAHAMMGVLVLRMALETAVPDK